MYLIDQDEAASYRSAVRARVRASLSAISSLTCSPPYIVLSVEKGYDSSHWWVGPKPR